MSRFISLSSTSRIFAIALLLCPCVPWPDIGRSLGIDSRRRQTDGTGGPHPQGTLDRDGTAHHLTKALANRQPEPCATIFARGRGIGLDECLEKLFFLPGGHADTGVTHPEPDPYHSVCHLTSHL